ncbi:hypothetical protein D1007_15638 [Hordeum vulgare]|nr:hypothetical protein D1007_15638 [Hordeum vulgare]
MFAACLSEWGPTKILPTWTHLFELSATSVALNLPGLFFDLIPPFLEFFDVVLMHYQIHMMHLDPRSILLLFSFAFLYEALLGVPPSVALFRHFLALRMTEPDQRSGCVSFEAVDTMEGECINMRIHQIFEGFRRQWVHVDAGQYIPLC